MTAREQHDKAVEAFNNHDADKVVEFYAPDAILYDPKYNESQNGRDAIRKDYENMFRSFPDIIVTRQEFLVNDSTAAWEIKLTGTNTGPIETPDGTIPPTNRPFELYASVFAELDSEGRYYRVRRYMDVPSLMKQLGLVD